MLSTPIIPTAPAQASSSQPPSSSRTDDSDDAASLSGPTSIHSLPPELIDHIFATLPASSLQQTTLSAMAALPDLPIREKWLFEHLRVDYPKREDGTLGGAAEINKELRDLWERLRWEKYERYQRPEATESESQAEDAESSPPPKPISLLSQISSFSFLPFAGDYTLLLNVLRLIPADSPAFKSLSLNMGTNVSPEHLSEVFEVKRGGSSAGLSRIELRFRPYVDRATYYQFLKGSYFDSAIETLSKTWPESPSLNSLSIVQDVPPRFSVPHLAKRFARAGLLPNSNGIRGGESGFTHGSTGGTNTPQTGLNSAIASVAASTVASTAASTTNSVNASENEESSSEDDFFADLVDAQPVEPAKGYTGHGPFPYLSSELQASKPRTFAQPVVFHDIQCLARLAVSPSARWIRDLRLRAPGRDLAKVLTDMGDGADLLGRRHFPRLRYLDISTSNVRSDAFLPVLIKRYGRLQHIVLDRTNLFGFRGKDSGKELCMELGKMIGMMGMQRGKERERELALWELGERRKDAIRERDERRRRAANGHAVGGLNGVAEEEGSESEELDSDGEPMPRAQPEPEPEPPEAVRPMERSWPRRNRRTVAVASFSIRENSRRNRNNQARSQDEDLEVQPPMILSCVLPPISCLRSVNLGGECLPLTPARADSWENGFQAGWKDGLGKTYEWANRVAEKYERAVKAAEAWHKADELEKLKSRGKGKKPVPVAKPKARPPLDVRLYRYPWPEEESLPEDGPFGGLIRLEELEWKDTYLQYLGDAAAVCAGEREAVTVPVLCCVPDCEGPMRRGDHGEKLDGRSGMKIVEGRVVVKGDVQHKRGCGHVYGQGVWSS